MNHPFRARPAAALAVTAVTLGAVALTASSVDAATRNKRPGSSVAQQAGRPPAAVNALGFSAPAGTLYQRQRYVDTSPEAVRRNDALLATLHTTNGGVRPAARKGKKAAPRPISRDEVVVRAMSWVDAKVPYCQTSWHTNRFGTYRQDCSGYVSMAWGAEEFYTGNVLDQATPIAWRNLRIGDALYYHTSGNKGHIVLFMGWANASASTMVVWHSTSTTNACPMADGARAGVFSTAQLNARGYTPIRYDLITDGPAPTPTVTVTSIPGPVEGQSVKAGRGLHQAGVPSTTRRPVATPSRPAARPQVKPAARPAKATSPAARRP